ncbi:hypothetical protein HZF08_33540 [Paenibacillus sp. CGMCC 1.16610]|uniref:DUF2975 domain-containing protein n=1 Tax=Paenibacillus anseongense TaxID=2682845 RepID=A0ABW9U103_9BACL|nr:hypothetical protein [Paenibacillus anseongense]MBA2943196.1 hypothetical protein [Paenibacillus sp. CGMCC 1.16610]MVQ33693.1 hypothetical protein [Paenibacillus anseongense]
MTLKPFIRTLTFYISLVLSVVFLWFFKNVADFSELIDYTSDTIASISATLMGIVIAGLAILISLTQGKLLTIFLQKNILQKFLFPFWVMTFLWGISSLICILIKLLQWMSPVILLYVFTVEVFIFVYALFGTISLMGHAIRFGLYVAKASEVSEE